MRAARSWLAVLGVLLAGGVAAAEVVVSAGRLGDDDFYRAVACGASPGGRCPDKITRWAERAARSLTVAVVAVDREYPEPKAGRVMEAVRQAIAEINGAGADVRLNLIAGRRADIRLFLVDAPVGGRIRGTGHPLLDGRLVEAGYTAIEWLTESGRIIDGAIAISRGILDEEIRSVVLEELVQSLGLIHDIQNRYYTRRSIFSEDGNVVTSIRGQDQMALRRHYPPG